jgi:hypothetical protein
MAAPHKTTQRLPSANNPHQTPSDESAWRNRIAFHSFQPPSFCESEGPTAPLSSPSTSPQAPFDPMPGNERQPRHPPPSKPEPQTAESSRNEASSFQAYAQFPVPSDSSQDTREKTSTGPFLKDLNLVAEAAKRAQSAILVRDLGGMAI